jgi:Uma2 family endonuclease
MTLHEHWTEPRPVKLTARDFLQLADAGALDAYPKTELIDGVIVAVSAQHSTHARVQSIFLRRIADALDGLDLEFEALVEVSIGVASDQVPQADIVVTNYRGPSAILPVSSIALVVEIADSSARFDRGTKARIYAEGGLAEYWVVDIHAREVVRCWNPGPGSYRDERRVPLGEQVESATVPGLVVDTGGIHIPD